MFNHRIVALAVLAALFSPPVHADLTLALVGPLSGQDASMGDQLRRGVEAAVAAANEAGGVLGQKIRVIAKDDACDPKQAVAVANQLVGEDVIGIIGPMCSGAAIPAAKVLAEEGIVMISPSATNPTLTEEGYSNVFRVCGRDDQQGAAVGAYIARKFPGARIALIHDKTAFGRGQADEVKKALNAVGVTEVSYDAIARGEQDFSALIAKLQQAQTTVIFFGGYHTEAGLLIRQIRAKGLTTQLISGDGLTTSEFWGITGEAGEGTLMAFNPDPRKNVEAADAVARLRAAGFEPEGYTLQSYAATEALLAAVAAADAVDGAKIAAALRAGVFATVQGKLSFDAKGDLREPRYAMYRWANGTYHEIED